MVKAINRMKEELFEEVKDVPYELPEGWKWVKLGNIAKINPKKSETLMFYGYERDDDVEVSFVPMSYVDDEKGIIVRKDKRFLKKVYKGYTCFKEGDIIFAKITPCMENGKCAIAKNLINGIGFGSTEFHVIRLNEGILNKFIWYYLRSEKIRDEAKKHFTGAVGHKRVPKEFLENLLVPLPFRDYKPDLEKQKQIVERIEALFKEIDKAIELRQKAIEETRKLFDSVLDRIFRKAEEDRKNWKWVMVSDFNTEIVRGVSFKKKEISESKCNNAVAILRANNITENGFDLKNLIYIDRRKVKERQLLKKGDIVYTTSSGSKHLVGKSAIVRKDLVNFSVGAFLSILRLKKEVLPEYFIYVFQSRLFRKHLDSRTVGMNINNIKKEDVLSFCFPIPLSDGKPDLRKQREVAKYLDNLNNKIKQFEELQSIQLEKFGQLKENILNKAFRGELI